MEYHLVNIIKAPPSERVRTMEAEGVEQLQPTSEETSRTGEAVQKVYDTLAVP